jgi:hypothetical protein
MAREMRQMREEEAAAGAAEEEAWRRLHARKRRAAQEGSTRRHDAADKVGLYSLNAVDPARGEIACFQPLRTCNVKNGKNLKPKP